MLGLGEVDEQNEGYVGGRYNEVDAKVHYVRYSHSLYGAADYVHYSQY